MGLRLLPAIAFAAAWTVAASAATPRASSWAAAESALTAQGDAPSLAAAAVLRFGEGSADALELAASAAQLAPSDGAIAWLRLQICTRTAGCDVRAAATDMRWADADNGAAWLPTLATAQGDHDKEGVDRVLGDMVRTERFDLYWNRLVLLVADALARSQAAGAGRSTERRRLDAARGAVGRLVPAFRTVHAACREGSAGERRELCRRLAHTMQHSDTVAAQVAGFALEHRLSPPESRGAQLAAQRRRVLEWRVARTDELLDPLLPWSKNARARELIARMRSLPRQEDAYRALLHEYRVATEPPENPR